MLELIAAAGLLAALGPAGDEVRLAWSFTPDAVTAGFASGTTPAATADGEARFAPDDRGGGLVLNSAAEVLVVAPSLADLGRELPTRALSVSAWVALERTHRWGGLVSCVQDNGDEEKGFVLGYENEVFSFGLSTTGADDGNGRITYLRGERPMEPGRWHHVAATFDGTTMRLYVDGELEAQSTEQSGEVAYDATAPLVLGSYRDRNEDFPLDGRMLSARIDSEVWSAGQVRRAYAERASLTKLAPWTDVVFGFLVDPYLTWPTATGMTVLFETTFPATAEVRYRADHETDLRTFQSSERRGLHECRLTGLEPDQKYFYQVAVKGPEGELVESPLLSFRTASSPDRAFTFAVIGDTQTHGDVAKRVSDLAWMHRPNFVVHAGDLVDAGTNKRDWTDVFFPSMQPLVGQVPLMPVLGNHEQDAEHYYRYMSLPEPERWYAFRYGNAEFFMIDGNRSLADQSAQLTWLEEALRGSKATWRFAVLHQPPYTSDSNDYGDTLTTTSTRGDVNVRNIIALLEEHGVDICFSGHVHDYERTFPILDGRVRAHEDGGVVYVTAAGGGGSLEDFDPVNTWFGHKKARYHHFVYVGIHGDHLEFQAIDEHGRLFDAFTLEKRRAR